MTPAERVAIREAIAKLEEALAEDEKARCPTCGAYPGHAPGAPGNLLRTCPDLWHGTGDT